MSPCWAVNSHKDDLKVLPEVAPAGRAQHFGSIKRIDKVNVRQGFKKKMVFVYIDLGFSYFTPCWVERFGKVLKRNRKNKIYGK